MSGIQDIKHINYVYRGTKIGASEAPLSNTHLKKLYNTLDYYIFLTVNPKNTPIVFDYNKVIKQYSDRQPQINIIYDSIDFEEFTTEKSLANTIQKIAKVFEECNKNIVFISNNIIHSTFVFSCFTSYLNKDNKISEILKVYLKNKEEFVPVEFLKIKHLENLFLDFTYACNIKFVKEKEEIEERKIKQKEEETKKKLELTKLNKEFDEELNQIASEYFK